MKKIYRNENSIILKNELQDFETGQLLSIAETQNFVIVQVADSLFSSRFCTPAHKQHCDLEITYSLANWVFCSTDGEKQKVGKNEVYLSYRGDIHELSSTKGCRFKTLAVNIKKGMGTTLFEKVKATFEKDRKCSMQDMSGILSAIVSEFSLENAPFSLELIDSLIIQILVKLARTGLNVPEVDVLSVSETLPSIVNYIDSNFLDICSLNELSSYFGYDYGHICKTFKKYYGVSPGHYLNSKKMDYGMILLGEGKSVKFIAEKLNYSNPYNFSRAFKAHFGNSPAHYRKKQG